MNKLIFIFFFTISFLQAKENILIQKAFIRSVPPNSKMTAGYMVIYNQSSKDIRLMRASSKIAKKIELHKIEKMHHKQNHEMMKMIPVPFIKIPAKGSVKLKKGGFHLMMMGLKRSLQVGEKIKVNFYFSDGIEITQSITVKRK